MMPAANLVDRLAGHKTVGAAPREELTWLASRGILRQMHPGQVLTAKGTRPEGLFVVLSGSFTMSVDRGAGPRKIMEWREGDVMGLLPYSRVAGPPGDSVAQEPSEILEVHGDQIRELTEKCHEITAILVHAMIDRARAFTSSDLHDEKMVSLGKLSAGLAHELNNPASAIKRSAALLDERLEDSERATRALGTFKLTETQLAAVDAAREACLARQESGVRSPIEQAEREEAMADWLADRGLDIAIAEPLADTAVTFEALDILAQAIDGPALNAVLRWGASGCSVRSLASEIQDAAMRISGLVTAIKGFTHMDQAAVAGPVDLVQGLSNTVTVLRAKARARSATVVVGAEPGLPCARGFAGELNQIWANLIDNALDAIPDSGRVEVTASREDRKVVVRVIDNGAGIPAQVRERIFDPFFTTKPMGQGTGLGLDIVRRLVRHNDGEISVESQPGRTQFRVALPLAEIDPAGGNL
jgi:signal transduction histidine kinase